jgi:hypothetical protein
MTTQYGQNNINEGNAQGRTITNTVGTPNATLTSSDVGKVIRFDTTAAVGTLTLPFAAEAGNGAQITIIKINNTNALTIGVGAGDTALGVTVGGVAAAQTIVNSSWVVASDGVLAWTVVGGQIQV